LAVSGQVSVRSPPWPSACELSWRGRHHCHRLAGGKTGASIGGEIMENTDLSAHQAAVFVVEAASAYCPGFLDQVTA